jgi:hypothetical protein
MFLMTISSPSISARRLPADARAALVETITSNRTRSRKAVISYSPTIGGGDRFCIVRITVDPGRAGAHLRFALGLPDRDYHLLTAVDRRRSLIKAALGR